ncbi:MAG: hypothetical protein V4658_13110 [Bacteroidota bacterium]
MKKTFNISLSVLLALSIVLGYTGVTVFKMVCASENGKVVLSVVDVKNDCEHSKKAEQDDCCKPIAEKQEEHKDEKKSCCDYSHQYQKIDDKTLVQQQQNSANHYLQCIIINTNAHTLTVKLRVSFIQSLAISPPPLLLKKQPFQAFTQSYLI